MPEQPANRALALSLSHAKGVESLATTGIEEEVIGLFDELRGALFRYCLAFRLPAPECEDVIQEVFLALFKHLQQRRSRRNLRGWTFRVAHNLALKKCHESRRYQQEADSTWINERADGAPNAEEQLVCKERRLRLVSVFDALPDEHRYCLWLRAEGLRYREIAEVLGISLGAVSEYLARSLERLARADGR